MGELRVLVTGAAGFIGSHAVDHLNSEGFSVLGTDRVATPRGVRLDLADPRAVDRTFRKFAPECVLHLAALASVPDCETDPAGCLRDNVYATVNVARTCGTLGVRLVFSSSAAVYGDRARVPTPVDSPTEPSNLYGISKLAGERICRTYAADSIVLRFFNVYGEGCRRSYVIPDVIRKLSSFPPVLRMSGTGREARDFVYVGDVVRALQRAAEGTSRGMYNVGTGRRTTLRSLARQIARGMGQPSVGIRFTGARPGDFRVNHADLSGRNRPPGWDPRVNLSEGLKRTLAAE